MKKFLFGFAAVAAVVLSACGASKFEIQEASMDCQVTIEVRYMQDDTVGVMSNNMLFLNASQLTGRDMFPLQVRVENFERVTPVTTLHTAEDFMEYLQRAVPGANRFGVVIGENAVNQIGFDEAETVAKIKAALQEANGGSAILFHEKGGEIVDMKKLY